MDTITLTIKEYQSIIDARDHAIAMRDVATRTMSTLTEAATAGYLPASSQDAKQNATAPLMLDEDGAPLLTEEFFRDAELFEGNRFIRKGRAGMPFSAAPRTRPGWQPARG